MAEARQATVDNGESRTTSDAGRGSSRPFAGLLQSADLRRVLPGLLLGSFLANVLALALPLAILQIFDRVVRNGSLETLFFLTVGVLVALLLEEFLRSINGVVTSWLGARFEHRATTDGLDHLYRTSMRNYSRQEPGMYGEKLNATATVSEFYSGQALLALFDLPFSLLFLGLIYLIGGWLVVVPLGLLLLFSVLIFRYGRWMEGQVRRRLAHDDHRFSFLSEALAGIHSIKTLMMERLMQRRYERLQETNATQNEQLVYGNAIATGIGTIFTQVMLTMVVFAGAVVVSQGEMTPGGLAACMMLSVRSLQPLRRSLSVWMRYQSFVAARERLGDVLGMARIDDSGKEALPPIREQIELRDVHVSHGSDEVFSGLSLVIPAGSCIGIIGESGSGKTSLLSLLNGVDRPDRGEIRVDGKSLWQYDLESVHRQIAHLPQTGVLVSGTILENLTMFDAALNERALEVSRELGLDRIVAGMRFGYETRLGEDSGETLSMGVRQLITIVRALVRDPQVILFDEANIALDHESDGLVRAFLERQKGKKTILLVSHRPSILGLADHLYVLENGRLKEETAEAVRQSKEAAHGGKILKRPATAGDYASILRGRFTQETDLSRCLLPLLDAIGWKGADRAFAEALPHLGERLDLSDLFDVLGNLGYQPKHLGSHRRHLDERLLPCLYVPEAGPAKVILKHLPDGSMQVFDGGKNRVITIEDLPRQGELYTFLEEQEGVSSKGDTPQTGWFASLAWRFRRHIVLAFVITVISTLLALAPPLFVRSIYDRVLPTGDLEMGGYLLAGVLIATALYGALFFLRSRILAYLGGRTEYILGSTVFERILALPANYVEGVSVSRQVGRIRNLERLREFFLGPLALLVFDLPAALILVAALGVINPWAVLVIGGAVLAYVVLGFAARRMAERSAKRSGQASALRWEFVNEALSAMRGIRAVGAGGAWMDRYRDVSGNAVMASFRDRQLQLRIGAVARFIGTATGVLALVVSAVLVIEGDITHGTMLATMILTWRIAGPLQNTFLASGSIFQVRNNIRQLENLMRLRGEAEAGARQSIRPDVMGELSFTRVSFRYHNEADPALLGVTFVARPRQMVAVTGADGAGKSTLLKLISRTYLPQAGTIRVDNVDIRQLSIGDLRSRISYMPQHCELFYGTVAQNLRLVHPSATDEELAWAVEMAGLSDDVARLSEGMETRISKNRSAQLPHGFVQRLSLARTILKPASIVLMDEPGNGMDTAGEEALIRCIRWLRGRATLVIVSQRPSHMAMSDTVFYLERGAITATGPFEKTKEKVMAGIA